MLRNLQTLAWIAATLVFPSWSAAQAVDNTPEPAESLMVDLDDDGQPDLLDFEAASQAFLVWRQGGDGVVELQRVEPGDAAYAPLVGKVWGALHGFLSAPWIPGYLKEPAPAMAAPAARASCTYSQITRLVPFARGTPGKAPTSVRVRIGTSQWVKTGNAPARWRPHPAQIYLYQTTTQNWGSPSTFRTSGEHCVTPGVCHAYEDVTIAIPRNVYSVRLRMVLPAQGGVCASTGYAGATR